jgi:3',5'-cyclic AMP phosphodiesterase CpdA
MVFKLLHLSDLHLAATPRQVDWLTFVRGLPRGQMPPQGWVGAWASSHHPGIVVEAARTVAVVDPDALVISGDLVTSGERQDVAMGNVFLNGAGAYQQQWLTVQAGQIFATVGRARARAVIPGNHDRYGALYSPGGRHCEAMMGWPQGKRVGPLARLQANGASLCILGIDCSLSANDFPSPPFGHLARGRVTDQILNEIRQAHAQLPGSGAVLWVVHWPPEFAPPVWLHDLINENALIQLGAALGVSLIVSGHTHRHAVYRTSSGIPVVCCGSTSQFAVGHGNTLQEIAVDVQGSQATVDVNTWTYDANAVRFVRSGIQQRP